MMMDSTRIFGGTSRLALYGLMLSFLPLSVAPLLRGQDTVSGPGVVWMDGARWAGSQASFLGVGVQEVDGERARVLKLRDEYGVEITRVEPDSPAQKGGLRVGDVILEYNGQRIEGSEQFARLVRETPIGRHVKFSLWRGGQSAWVETVIGSRPANAFAFSMPEAPKGRAMEMVPMVPDMPSPNMNYRNVVLGIEAEALGDSQLAGYFGVKGGVLVRSVNKNSAAERAGLKAGDVLQKVGETRTATPFEVSNALRMARSNGKTNIPLTVVRDRRETTMQVGLEDDQGPALTRGRSVSDH